MKETANSSAISPLTTQTSPWHFFTLVFCWTWFFWILAVGLGASILTAAGQVLLILGLLGPMLGGIGFTYLTQGNEGRRDYWSRIVDPRRIPAKWYLVIFLFVPVLMAIAVLLDIASGGDATLAKIGERVMPFLCSPLTIIPLLLRVFIQGPIPEELGWRGYVLDRLQARWNALVSSLILGAIWALWHLPLFFFNDMVHSAHGLWSPWFWQFLVGIVPMAVILTWIFNNTGRSTLGAILFHFVANLTYVLANVSAGTNFFSTLLWIVAAIVVIAFWGAEKLPTPAILK